MPDEPVLRSVEPITSVSRFKYGPNLNVSSNCIEIAQFNANSLLGHIDLIKAHLDSHFYHIISISETWLHSDISDDMVRLGDFTLIRNDHTGKLVIREPVSSRFHTCSGFTVTGIFTRYNPM